MDRYVYFTVRLRLQKAGVLNGVVERLGSGERREFVRAEELWQQLSELALTAPLSEDPASEPVDDDPPHSRRSK